MLGYVVKYSVLCCAIAAMAGCAGSDERYPSLAIRDSERFGGELAPATATAAVAIAPVPAASISTAFDNAAQSNAQFVVAQPNAARLARAARGTSSDSDVRSRALVALAELTSLRAQTMGALASLDALEADAATRFAATQDIESEQAKVSEMLAAQNAAISAIELEMGL